MHIVKSVGVLSVARILGMIQACIGLLFAPLFLLFGLIGSMAGSMAGHDRTPFAGVFGVFFALFMPVIYGVMGFIVGAIGAFLYNIFAKWVGGFEVEIDLASAAPVAPPVAPYPLVPPMPNV